MPPYTKLTNIRLEKSLSEKIYLLSATQLSDRWIFKVRGQSKNIYEQVLYTSFSCSCPDHRTKRSFCKHLLYLIARVAVQMDLASHLSNDKNLWNDTAYTICNDSWIERLKSRISNITKPTTCIGTDCPICFEEMKETEIFSQCISTCKNYFHKECIELWINSSHDTCPLCRAKWVEEEEEAVISLAMVEPIQNKLVISAEQFLIMNVHEICTIGEFKKEIFKSDIFNQKMKKRNCKVYYEIITSQKISNSKISDENSIIIIDKETNIIYKKNEAKTIAHTNLIITNNSPSDYKVILNKKEDSKYDIYVCVYSSNKILYLEQKVLFIL